MGKEEKKTANFLFVFMYIGVVARWLGQRGMPEWEALYRNRVETRNSSLKLASFTYLLLQPELLLSKSQWLPPALLWSMRHKISIEERETQALILCNKSKRKTV